MTKSQTHQDSNSADLISALRQGQQERLREVYESHRDAFLSWALSHFDCQEDDAREVYQDVILAFYENVMNGKINALSSQLRTYLFGIGRFMLLKQYRQRKRFSHTEDLLKDSPSLEGQLPGNALEEHERSDIIRNAIRYLGDNCRELLIRVYYQNLSGEVIATQLGYKNADVVKSQKSRCMKQLRSLITDQFDRDEV